MCNIPNTKAVLTGDIIESSKLTPASHAALYAAFADASRLLRQHYPAEVSYNISNFRGDGWQIVCNRPEKSLEIGIFMRSYLRFTFKAEKLDSRFAIGIGFVNFIPAENVSAGDGEAYTLSGHLLDTLGSERMAVSLPERGAPLIQVSLDGILSLLDFIVSAWSPSQAQAVFLGLQGHKQEEIARRWVLSPITQASVSATLKIAGWTQLRKSLTAFENLVASASPPA